MALENLTPSNRFESILDGQDIEPSNRKEYFMQKAANEVPKPAGSADAGKAVLVNEDGDGYELGEIPSALPPYTSADNGKVLTIGEDAEHPVQQTIIPEQSVTLSSNGSVWVSVFGVDSGVNTAFFENASVGDKCNISLDGATAVECTAIDFSGYTLFPIGTFYVGYASLFGGTGIATLVEPAEKTHTISASANAPSVVVEWANNSSIVILPSANEIGNYVTDIFEVRAANATVVGTPVYDDVTLEAATNNEQFDLIFERLLDAFSKGNKAVMFDGFLGTKINATSGENGIYYFEVQFVQPMRYFSSKYYNYTYELVLRNDNGRHFGVRSLITLLSQPGKI